MGNKYREEFSQFLPMLQRLPVPPQHLCVRLEFIPSRPLLMAGAIHALLAFILPPLSETKCRQTVNIPPVKKIPRIYGNQRTQLFPTHTEAGQRQKRDQVIYKGGKKITVVQTFLKQYSILEDDRTIPIKFSRKVCPNICISSYIAF